MKKVYILILFCYAITMISCGEGTVEVTGESYEPMIAIEGFLVAGRNVERIRISRNFVPDEDLSRTNLVIDNADVRIIDETDSREYSLDFHRSVSNFDSNWYEYRGSDLRIENNKTYTLDVRARVRGLQLHAFSSTTVPEPGLDIAQINHTNLAYRERDEQGNLIKFEMVIDRAPGTSFYVITAKALQAGTDNFIYENPFAKLDPADVEEDLNDFSYQYGWIQDTPLTVGQTDIDLFWTAFWFYSEYQIIVYAADKNYREFLQTYNDVQENDGNFHEAKFNISGDGIGVFGSMAADTVYVQVTRE